MTQDPHLARGFPGHFGELIQGRLGRQGPVVLITLPMRRPVLTLAGGVIGAQDEWGQGLGLSTARHLAELWQSEPGADLARQIAYCLGREGASDPMMFPDPVRVLWASRRGQVLGSPLPCPADFDLLSGLWGQGQVTDPKDEAFPDVADLVADWPRAAGDLAQMARLVSTSARRCLDLRGPMGDPTPALADQLGAAGFQIAHTGSARGLIFAPGRVPDTGQGALARQGFRRIRVLRFRSGWLEG